MAENYKVLGQVAPNAASVVPLYTVPLNTTTVISTISVCNFGSASTLFSIAVCPNAETLSLRHYLVYDGGIGAKDTAFFTIGATVDSSDIIRVISTSGSLAFNAFGSEIT